MKTRNVRTGSAGFPGIASLVIIFTVLCIAVVAILSLSKAVSDRKLAAVSRDNFLSYCEAENLAQQEIAELRTNATNGTYELRYPVSDNRELQISVLIDGSKYEIVSHKTVYISQWEGNETLDVWKP